MGPIAITEITTASIHKTTYKKKRIPVGVELSRLEKQRTHTAHFGLFLDEDLEVLVNDGDG